MLIYWRVCGACWSLPGIQRICWSRTSRPCIELSEAHPQPASAVGKSGGNDAEVAMDKDAAMEQRFEMISDFPSFAAFQAKKAPPEKYDKYAEIDLNLYFFGEFSSKTNHKLGEDRGRVWVAKISGTSFFFAEPKFYKSNWGHSDLTKPHPQGIVEVTLGIQRQTFRLA